MSLKPLIDTILRTWTSVKITSSGRVSITMFNDVHALACDPKCSYTIGQLLMSFPNQTPDSYAPT